MAFPEATPELPVSPAEIDLFLSRPNEAVCDALRNLEGDIVVLGAGGKMGLHLSLMLKFAVDELGQANRVIAVSRFGNLKSKTEYEQHGIETVAGDLRDEAFVKSLPEAPTVFYLVGAKFGTADRPDLLHETNVVLAERLAYRYRNARIVAFSTGCVYSFVTPGSGGSHEGSPTNPVGEYAQSCLQREACFEAASQRYDTPVVLIRLNYAVEFRYGVLVDIASKVLRGEAVDVSTGFVNFIWQNDALCQIVQSLALAQAPAIPLNITGADILSVRELAEEFGKKFGRPVKIDGEEGETAWLSNAARSHRLFGEPSVEVDTMIDWVAAWLTSGGGTYGKPTGFEKRDGKF
ncbi:NAD(P)-dependent oxidoreductase [Pelagicoccus sp. SDUM812005]|uniref:NAD-dependent epimerase/dehydratase family protein n=1 Tax=Pelagicoccus sp. SDUM812005 TaxID=3041257 RepID=UPI00280EDC9C|nr:NAD(P)-dependent oxidoreductase [Pelagicoccus sp. SDUM812005]MDQ8183116.1 NAD(P)-dependent oxidoreductase [Pelagicoccus sp. SDUM812005]